MANNRSMAPNVAAAVLGIAPHLKDGIAGAEMLSDAPIWRELSNADLTALTQRYQLFRSAIEGTDLAKVENEKIYVDVPGLIERASQQREPVRRGA